jgi:hypothetical protein
MKESTRPKPAVLLRPNATQDIEHTVWSVSVPRTVGVYERQVAVTTPTRYTRVLTNIRDNAPGVAFGSLTIGGRPQVIDGRQQLVGAREQLIGPECPWSLFSAQGGRRILNFYLDTLGSGETMAVTVRVTELPDAYEILKVGTINSSHLHYVLGSQKVDEYIALFEGVKAS